MKQINLRELYPNVYKTDTYVEVTDEVLDAMKAQDRTEANQRRLIRRYKAYHSLDSENGIVLWSSIFVTLVAKKYHESVTLPSGLRMVYDNH